ncbi:hypothetical protein M3Y96_00101600 [Aphelenchoides besseyi]|nr:hypothetical protein M3Y96_00101600 [Aphelenchoides besseyi]
MKVKNTWTDEDRGIEGESREQAYRVVLIVSLCISVLSCTIICSVYPLLYQFMSLSNTQYGNVLDFCEWTAGTVVDDTAVILADSTKLPIWQQYMNQTRHGRQVGRQEPCNCEAPRGLPGLPGRRGLKGSAGRVGMPGNPARLPCQLLTDFKKYCPKEGCPQGLQGPPGQRGDRGAKGEMGVKGNAGKKGEDGLVGLRGPPGRSGPIGIDGEDGDPGVDAENTPFIVGPPGPKGEAGDVGPAGPVGLPGISGPTGPMGKRGQQGRHGVPGLRGQTGPEGYVGDPGPMGDKGVCPTYCANDGGVFFVDLPETFFKDN